MQIKLAHDCGKSRPEGPARTFKAGQLVSIAMVDWPGKPLPHGPARSWSFWTLADIDRALIFGAGDVAELVLQAGEQSPELAAALAGALFRVTIASE